MKQARYSLWLQWIFALMLPILLVNINLRLVTGHWFVRWEYGKPGFPPDPYGLSTAERIRLATVCQDYLATNADISLLADLELTEGGLAFNARELRHMSDVQAVYHGIVVAGIVAAVVCIGVGAVWVLSGTANRHLPTALVNGSLVTLGLLAAVGGFMLVSWGEFFTTFHRIFFTGETWIFPNSDTLIRLFPTRFWIDIAATLVGLLVIQSITLGVISRSCRPTARHAPSSG